jgi:hypothetical protein
VKAASKAGERAVTKFLCTVNTSFTGPTTNSAVSFQPLATLYQLEDFLAFRGQRRGG